MNTDERRCPDSLTERVIGAILEVSNSLGAEPPPNPGEPGVMYVEKHIFHPAIDGRPIEAKCLSNRPPATLRCRSKASDLRKSRQDPTKRKRAPSRRMGPKKRSDS